MKPQERYSKFVRWGYEDSACVGYCPALFPWGGVCHGATEEETYASLGALVREDLEDLHRAGKETPAPATRPMREAALA